MQHLPRLDLRVVEHSLLARADRQRGVGDVVDEVGLALRRASTFQAAQAAQLGARADQVAELRQRAALLRIRAHRGAACRPSGRR